MTRRLRLDVSFGIARLALASPPRNTLDLAAFDELGDLVAGALPGLDVTGLVVSGEGRHFSSGADIEELAAAFHGTPPRGALLVAAHGDVLRAIEALPYPTVAAISGSCLGAGLELALACRFRVASRRAVMALPEVEFGLMPGLGGVTRLAALVGRARAAELVLTGRTVDAEEGLAIGLVDAVVERASLAARAEAVARDAARTRSREVLP